ncbi:MAG TPA: flagellar motor protein [Bryobacteraceae bacterium]|jgi:chemotaxis protein MotA|nr:flagellar motor protein [Bryobacteraceae bacterium]
MPDKEPGKAKLRSTRPDVASLLGIAVAVGALIGGLILDGGKISDVTQITAAIIVLGGTLGAVMVTSPLSSLISAAAGLKKVFLEEAIDNDAAIEEIVAYATKARKSSLISLEEDLEKISEPFLKKALTLAVDGTDLHELRKIVELDLEQGEKKAEAQAKVFEAAGGYSPTIGIIGAVMGLIQVMKHLENIDEVGKGIAIAFVATVYGVAVANLFFLPAANKLKSRAQKEMQLQELMMEGVSSILEGMNPKLIRVKLEAFSQNHGKKVKAAAEKSGAGAPAAAEG